MARKKRRNKPPQRELSARQIADAFFACGRCSFFLTAVQRLLNGDTLAQRRRGNWLELPWGTQMHTLLQRTYSVELYGDTQHYESCCRECSRVFVLGGVDADTRFRIQIKPRSRSGGRK